MSEADAIRVDGMDPASRSYRLTLAGQTAVALLPETLVAEDLGLPGSPRHGDVYLWLSRNTDAIALAIRCRIDGKTPRPPFDKITLEQT